MRFDGEAVRKALQERYGKERPGGTRVVRDVGYIADGIAHEMYFFRVEANEPAAGSEGFILRMGDDPEALRREHRALTALQDTKIPVPRVHDTGEMLGQGFIILEHVAGLNLHGALGRVPGLDVGGLFAQFATLLADIQRLDWRDARFDFLARPEGEYGYVDSWLVRFRTWSANPHLAHLLPVLEWLEDRKPPAPRYVLLHGDYLPNNVIIREGRIVGLVDWDGVSIGDPAYDVGWPPLAFRLFGDPDDPIRRMPAGAWNDGAAAPFRDVANVAYYQVLRAVALLHFAAMLKSQGARSLGAKDATEAMVRDPRLDFAGRCSEFIAAETGVVVPIP